MDINDFGLQKIHMDVLAELGNIGAGNAITALSELLNKRIDMKVPNVNVVKFSDVADFVGGPEKIVSGVLIKFSADINGMIMFMMDIASMRRVLSSLLDTEVTEEELSQHADKFYFLNDFEESAFQEIGNILAGSYLSALADMINLKVVSSVPSYSIDMAGAILSVPAIEFSKVADEVLFIESIFNANNTDVVGYFILVPDYESFKLIFSALGVL